MPHDLFSRWRYSTRILFSGCDQAVYQQDLVIHRTAGQDYEEVSGGLKVWHIYLGPQCRADYGDLRFSDRYGRELAYYLWPDYDAESARFCVRLEGADQSGALVIWYGNPTATTTSDVSVIPARYTDIDDHSYIVPAGIRSVSVLVVAGGGASGKCSSWGAGGGGAGGLIFEESYSVTPGEEIPVRVGAGGIPGAGSGPAGGNGNDSIFGNLTAIGGGGGGGGGGAHAKSGGSGGGGGYVNDFGAGTPGQGHAGGRSNNQAGAGGGGAGGPGNDAVSQSLGGVGGPGLRIWGDLYAVGGSGVFAAAAEGGSAGGAPGDPNTGNGGGATKGQAKTGHGGSGIVIVSIGSPWSAAPPSLLRTSRGVNPAYAGLARLTGSAAADDGVIQFAGVGSIRVVGDEREAIAGAGSLAIETSVRSSIPIAGAAGIAAGTCLMPTPAALSGAGVMASEPVRLRTPLDMESGEGLAYVAPTPVQFDVWQYRFESLDISRSAQDALWRCDGQIDGLQAPLAYKSFTVRVPDHSGVLRTIFFGFVPGRDYVQAAAANKSTVQGFDAGFYLTRQYLPDGDLYYPARFLWTPMNLIKYWLGEETTRAGSPSRWERVSGIMPYRIHDPITWGHSYTPKDWNFQPKTTKAQAIQEVCEYSGMVFLIKWRSVNGAMTPCAYLVHQDDIDHATHGLDLPAMVTFTHPDPCIANGVRATLQSDEKYNRIEVRSATPSGVWFHAVRETAALRAGEELPIEYLEERSDLPIDADHGGWCNARANELYAYYTAYSYTYTLTLIDRVDLELYQRCRFYGFDAIPNGATMRIVAIRYNVRPTHTEAEIVVTPDSRLSDLRRLQRSQAADSVSEVQTIAQGQIDQIAMGEVGTVVGIDGAEAIVELERRADSSVRGRIV